MDKIFIPLKDLRRQHQLSQDELAKRLGVSRQTVFAIETGRSEPSLSLAIKLSSLFDTAIEDLLSALIDEAANSNQSTNQGKEVKNMTPNLIPLSPLSELTDLHREIDRFFEEAATPRPAGQIAAMNVHETEKNFEVEVAVPGFSEEEIDIEAGQDFLTVKGSKKMDSKEEKKNYLKREFGLSQFERSITLPSDIQTDKIEADMKHGTLHISLPKVEPSKPEVTKVKVKSK